MLKNNSVIATLSDRLRRDISLGILGPGLKLNIEALKRSYSVSHPSVREALSLLVGEGYVSFEELKGFRVLHASQEQLKDSSRVRAELEALAFAWSVERSTVDWRSSVIAAHYALSEVEKDIAANPQSAALDWDNRNKNFHMAIAGNSGSQKLINLISVEYNQSRRYRLMAHARDRSEKLRSRWVERSAEEHAVLKDAVIKGDVETGQAILRKHITKATLHVIEGAELPEDLKKSS